MIVVAEKTCLEELAVLGGSPAFADPLHVGCPNIGNRHRLLQRINDLLDRRRLTNNGPYVEEFEQKLARFLGVKHCIPMCNATIALEIAVRTAGLAGEVIVPSFTFVGTVHALQWQQIRPVFCDIDRRTYTLCPSRVEELITPQTTGILGVHLWGRPCEVDTLTGIARQRNLRLLFDAAHGLGVSYKGRMIGNFGDAEVLSFHATKFFNTFEGGAIVTNDDELASRARLMRNFGFAGQDRVISLGTNGKMSEVAAAMGLTSFESLEEFIGINRRNYELYRSGLAGIPGITLMRYDEHERHNYHHIVVEVDDSLTPLTRDHMRDVLWAENVLARRYFYPGCHRMEPYRSRFPDAGHSLRNTEYVSDRVLSLPNGTVVGPEEIRGICQIVRLVIARAPLLVEQLEARGLPRILDRPDR